MSGTLLERVGEVCIFFVERINLSKEMEGREGVVLALASLKAKGGLNCIFCEELKLLLE